MRQWSESSNALLHLDNVRSLNVIEPILSGIVLGLIPVTLAGLFVAAYLQYRRGNELGL